jgi:hypothetical protein
MRRILAEVLDLQPKHSADNTVEMELRGERIRDDGPDWLKSQIPSLTEYMPSSAQDLKAQGKDGSGAKTLIPWIRLYSTLHSPKPTTGFYVFYVFSQDGTTAYLSLTQGTSSWVGGDLQPQNPDVLRERVNWARGVLASATQTELLTEISLGGAELAEGYQLGNIYALKYSRDNLPSETTLANDLAHMAGLLGNLYRAEDEGWIPGNPPPEIIEVIEAVEESLTGKSSPRAGFRTSAPQRQAIELHAMEVAREQLELLGWVSFKDCHGNKPYDYEATFKGQRTFIEVKGTTSDGSSVILTNGEVAHIETRYPNTALVIVSHIKLSGTEDDPIATGGSFRLVHPWQIEEQDLKVISYQYQTQQNLEAR